MIIYHTPYEKARNIPLPGKVCDAYHDGKLSPSRMARVEILDLVNRADLPTKYWKMWMKTLRGETKEVLKRIDACHFSGREDVFGRSDEAMFFDWNCREFVIGKIVGDPDTEKDPILFARVKRGWYGVNWNYLLDVDGRVRKANIRDWRKCAAECGQRMRLNRKTGLYEYEATGGKPAEKPPRKGPSR